MRFCVPKSTPQTWHILHSLVFGVPRFFIACLAADTERRSCSHAFVVPLESPHERHTCTALKTKSKQKRTTAFGLFFEPLKKGVRVGFSCSLFVNTCPCSTVWLHNRWRVILSSTWQQLGLVLFFLIRIHC